MDTIKLLARQHIKENRWAVIVYCLGFAVISTVITTLFSSIQLTIVGIIVATLIVYIYFAKIQELVNYMVRDKVTDNKIIFGKPQFTQRYFIGFAMFVGFALISFLLLYFLSSIPGVGMVILISIVIFLGIITGTVSIFVELEDETRFALKIASSSVSGNFSLLFHYIFRFLTVVIQGAVATLCVNVFVFGPQIQKILESGRVSADDEIMAYFTNSTSNFIQIVGAQTIVFYMLFVGTIIYKTYSVQKHLHKRRKK